MLRCDPKNTRLRCDPKNTKNFSLLGEERNVKTAFRGEPQNQAGAQTTPFGSWFLVRFVYFVVLLFRNPDSSGILRQAQPPQKIGGGDNRNGAHLTFFGR